MRYPLRHKALLLMKKFIFINDFSFKKKNNKDKLINFFFGRNFLKLVNKKNFSIMNLFENSIFKFFYFIKNLKIDFQDLKIIIFHGIIQSEIFSGENLVDSTRNLIKNQNEIMNFLFINLFQHKNIKKYLIQKIFLEKKNFDNYFFLIYFPYNFFHLYTIIILKEIVKFKKNLFLTYKIFRNKLLNKNQKVYQIKFLENIFNKKNFKKIFRKKNSIKENSTIGLILKIEFQKFSQLFLKFFFLFFFLFKLNKFYFKKIIEKKGKFYKLKNNYIFFEESKNNLTFYHYLIFLESFESIIFEKKTLELKIYCWKLIFNLFFFSKDFHPLKISISSRFKLLKI
jgi:hypothetical protein